MTGIETGKRSFDFEALKRGVSVIEFGFSIQVESDGNSSILYASVAVE
ncbi:hypothetical protein [Mesotoga sp. Brook.08.YT.4.2.5.1]|nr:hypothetical protein [Mesotoga sp. Brook.08.YT.4.2.5.1]RAO96306.1 hypothetical protein M388_02495 [Mesotoga sp. Brook.08.YT.4.2.5.4.]